MEAGDQGAEAGETGGLAVKRQMRGGDEYDAFTGWRKYYRWRPGELRFLKRRANKRERRKGKFEAGKEAGAQEFGRSAATHREQTPP